MTQKSSRKRKKQLGRTFGQLAFTKREGKLRKTLKLRIGEENPQTHTQSTNNRTKIYHNQTKERETAGELKKKKNTKKF